MGSVEAVLREYDHRRDRTERLHNLTGDVSLQIDGMRSRPAYLLMRLTLPLAEPPIGRRLSLLHAKIIARTDRLFQ